MRLRSWFVLFLFVVLAAGCKREAVRNTNKVLREQLAFWPRTIPTGEYDAVFDCVEDVFGWSKDSVRHDYEVTVSFPPDARQDYHIPKGSCIPPSMQVVLNGNPLNRGQNEKFPAHYPTPLTWQLKGDERFPSFSHITATDSSIEFFSPNDGDSVSLSRGFEIKYHAPKDIDTVLIHMSYFGKSELRRDTTGKVQDYGQSYYNLVPNTGSYIVPAFKMFDYYKSFDPRKLLVDIWWVKGDTIHVGDCVYGFETECHFPRYFYWKP